MTRPTSTIRSNSPSSGGWLRRISIVMACMLQVGCAQSQSGMPAGTGTDLGVDPLDSIIWTADAPVETTGLQMGVFELREPADLMADELRGIADGQTTVLIALSDNQAVEVALAADLDGDGRDEIVYSSTRVGSSGCCPSTWHVLSYRGKGRYWNSPELGKSLHPPRLARLDGLLLLELENIDQDPYRCYSTLEQFSMVGQEMVLKRRVYPKDLETLVQVALRPSQDPPADSTLVLRFDLDGDNKVDEMAGSYLPKWGRVYWSLALGNGTMVYDGPPFRRLGVLPSKTNGFHDLVVDADRIYTWTGKRYDVKED